MSMGSPVMVFLLVNAMIPSIVQEWCHVVRVTKVDIVAIMELFDTIILLRYKASKCFIRGL